MENRDNAQAGIDIADALGRTVLDRADITTKDGFADAMTGVSLLAARLVISAAPTETARMAAIELLANSVWQLLLQPDEFVGPVDGNHTPSHPSKVN